jgi:hypothetical protein
MKRFIGVSILAFVMLLALAAPAMAVSSITNSFSMNDLTISTGQAITSQAKTVFGNVVMPNPYPSSFHTEMNAYHFNKPVNTGWSVVTPTWVYKSTGRFTSPCYQVDSGTIWFTGLSTITAYVNYTATAKSAPAGSVRKHRHGNYEGRGESSGPAVWRSTTHN